MSDYLRVLARRAAKWNKLLDKNDSMLQHSGKGNKIIDIKFSPKDVDIESQIFWKFFNRKYFFQGTRNGGRK